LLLLYCAVVLVVGYLVPFPVSSQSEGQAIQSTGRGGAGRGALCSAASDPPRQGAPPALFY